MFNMDTEANIDIFRTDTFASKLLNNKADFDAFIYTPWRKAVEEICQREQNEKLQKYIKNILPETTPSILRSGPNMVLARHIATPNYETYRFLHASDVLPKLKPIIAEYKNDKYTNSNTIKHSLAQLNFYSGRSNKGEIVYSQKSVIDRNLSSGIRLSDIKTKSEQSFLSFHHDFLNESIVDHNIEICDVSEMYASLGGTARQYYKGFLSLFLMNNILFEDFLTTKEEGPFTEKIVIPTLCEIFNETGVKPLIVSLGPKGNEDDLFWFSYPPSIRHIVDKKL